MPSSNQTQRANITELVESCTFGVSIARMTDFSVGFAGQKLFQPGTMLTNVIGVEITDSLDQYFKIGKVVLNDQTQLAEITPFTGNEIVGIRYKNKANDQTAGARILYFRIFDVQQIENFKYVNASPGSKFIVMHLVEFPAFEMFTTSTIYKSYPNNQATISDIVFDSLKGINFIESYYNIANPQPTKGVIDFWIPNWTFLKTLKYLQQFAVTANNDPFYVLTITQDDMSSGSNAAKQPTIHYNSIFMNLQGVAGRTFSSQRAEQKNRDPNDGTGNDVNSQNDQTKPPESQDTGNAPPDVILGRMQKSFDGSMLFFGMNGETIIGRDAIGGTSYFATTYENYLETYSALGMWSVYQQDANLKSWGNQWATIKNSFLSPSSINQVQGYFRNLYSKRMMLGSNRIIIISYINEFRKTGEKVKLMLPSSNKAVGIDLMNSGDWMIYSITDKIDSSGRATSEIELVRDSYFLIPSQNINNYIPRINTLSSNLTIKGS